MKAYFIERCSDCPEFVPSNPEYTDDGRCRRTKSYILESEIPPSGCPLKTVHLKTKEEKS